MKKKNKFFEGIKAVLQDAIAHKQGKLDFRFTAIEIPEPPCDKSDQKKKQKELAQHLKVFYMKKES